jgi:hypothetical protein
MREFCLIDASTLNEFQARRLNPTQALAERFRDLAARFAREVARRTPVAYNVGRVPATYEVAYINVDEVPGLGDLLSTVEEPAEVELFNPGSPEARRLRFYVVGVRRPNPGWVHFFKSKGETLRLRRTRKIAAVMRGATYDELHEDPLIFDASYDAIVVDDIVFVVNQGAFQRSLGFVEQARELAGETIDELAAQLEITNMDDFRAAATSDINMVAKVRSIAEKMTANPAYAAAMTTDSVIDFAQANNIDIDFEVVDGRRRLVFHAEPARRWRILKLLDDDYLHSQLTEVDYEVNSKSPRV